MTGTNLSELSATRLLELLDRREITSVELVEASLARIEALDPQLNAFVSLDRERAVEQARNSDRRRAASPASTSLGRLEGLPIAVKDLTDVEGFPTTQGSLLFEHAVARSDEESVRRLRQAGAIVLGKTNTPEFGFGAVCTNRLFGPTRNPWNPELTSGGSSGGSAVAVTTGMVPLAHGTDFGGSVRTPASFCGCVGLRPTPGRIAEPRRPFGWDGLATQGALARTSADAGLMVEVMSGPHRLDPLSTRGSAATRGSGPGRSAPPNPADVRVAASCTLGDAYRVDEAVHTAFERSVTQVEDVLGPVDRAWPDVTGGSAAFQTLRASLSWAKFRSLIVEHRAELTESFVWNAERGRDISAEQWLSAEQTRTRIYRAFCDFFDRYDVLIVPSASVLPFPVDGGEVDDIGGHPTETIIDYLACTYLVSLVGCPSLAIPTPDQSAGLPFGVQLIAAPDAEATLLTTAAKLEANGFCHRWP